MNRATFFFIFFLTLNGANAEQDICQQSSFEISNSLLLEDILKLIQSCSDLQTLNLAPGFYPILKTIHIKRDNLKIIGNSSDPRSVIISGDNMSPEANVGNVIKLSGKNITIDGLTLENSKFHLIQIAGELGAQSPNIKNCVLRNSYQQLLKVTYGNSLKNRVENGVIENCHFEYSQGIGPNWYIGGIDAHGAINWTVKNNIFKDISSPAKQQAEHAIHFWNNSENNTVVNNLILNCDRGIGFGLGREKGNRGGLIKDNIIIHENKSNKFSDVGISLESSPYTRIENNIIALQHFYPNAIEYRFEKTLEVVIQDNISNKSITKRNNAQANLLNNKKLSLKEIKQLIEAGKQSL